MRIDQINKVKLAALIFAWSFLINVRALGFQFVWDDQFQITDNRAVVDGAGISEFFLDGSTTSSRPDFNSRVYRPLRNLVFRAIAVTFDIQPAPFHTATVTFFASCAALAFLLAVRLFQDQTAAFWIALWWAALPVHAEVACYSSALGDALSLTFQLAAFLCCVNTVTGKHPIRYGVAAAFLLACAMFTKEMAITMPAVFAAFILLFGWHSRRAYILLGTLILTTLLYLVLRTTVIGRIGQEDMTLSYLFTGLANAPVALVHYIGIMLMPIGHRPSYLQPELTPTVVTISLVGVALLVVACLWLDRRQRHRGFRAGVAWIAISLLPVLHLVPVWVFMADRFSLAPSVGWIFVGVATYRSLWQAHRSVVRIVGPILLGLYVASTFLEQSKWQDNLALFQHDVIAEPRSSMAQSNYCTMMLKIGNPQEALRACRTTYRLGRVTGDVHLRMATALESLDRLDEAATEVRAALALDPDSGAAHAFLGNLLLKQNNVAGARRQLHLASISEPDHPSILLLEAELAVIDKTPGRAYEALDRLFMLHRKVERFRYLGARIAVDLGDHPRAKRYLSDCLQINPTAVPCLDLSRTISDQHDPKM